MGTFVVPYLTLYLSRDRGLSFSTTGRVIAAGGVGLLVGNIVGGWLCDRVGRKTCLLTALAINGLGVSLLGMGLGTSAAYGLALGFALAGVGMYTPAANAWIADLTATNERQLAYTVNYICINVGMGLGPLLGGVLASASFRWLFVGDVVSTMICAVLIASASSRSPLSFASQASSSGSKEACSASMNKQHSDALSRTKRWRVLLFCAASFFVIAPLMGMEYVVPLFVGTVLDEPLALVGVVYTINAASILLFGFPMERLVAQRDAGLMMVLAAMLWAIGLSILAVGGSAVALLSCTFVWTLGEMIGSVVVPTYVSNRVPEHMRGRYLAVVDAMRSLAGIIAPIALGLVWEHHGVNTVLWVLVATPLVGGGWYGALWLFASRGRS